MYFYSTVLITTDRLKFKKAEKVWKEQTKDKLAGFTVLSNLPADWVEFIRKLLKDKVFSCNESDFVGPNSITNTMWFIYIKYSHVHVKRFNTQGERWPCSKGRSRRVIQTMYSSTAVKSEGSEHIWTPTARK